MKHKNYWIAAVAIAFTSISLSAEVIAPSTPQPPGDVTLASIVFTDKAVANLEAPGKDTQARLIADSLSQHYEKATFFLGKHQKTLYVVGAGLGEARIDHFSDCAVNSQYKFQQTPSIVKASFNDVGDKYPLAERKGMEQALALWTHSRHGVGKILKYRYRSTRQADITIDYKQLDNYRASLKKASNTKVAALAN